MKKFRQTYDNVPQEGLPQESFHQTTGRPDFDIDFVTVNEKNVDRAMLLWFSTHHPIYVTLPFKERYKVPAIWHSAERFAMMNGDKHIRLRDEHGILLLPLISINRQQIDMIPERTAAVDKAGTTNFRVAVREYIDPVTMEKVHVLSNNTTKDPEGIKEIIEITAPKMMKYTYNVVAWSKFRVHANLISEHIIGKFGQHHAVYCSEHLFFGAYLEGQSEENNAESLGIDERLFKTTFTIAVEAPLITEESIRRFRTIQRVNVEVKIGDVTLSKIESDAIRDKVNWSHPYKLRRDDPNA